MLEGIYAIGVPRIANIAVQVGLQKKFSSVSRCQRCKVQRDTCAWMLLQGYDIEQNKLN